MNFSNLLIQWYLQNKRDLPWRNTQDPYPIWLSEIMLQQTRVAQGLPYFLSFTNAFPTIFDLANASEEQVLKLWQGLGYYSRARNLHQTAQHIAFNLNGVFPNSYKELLLLKGIGDYTAAAIASFAYEEAVPVVDGNVFRVLSRYFALETDIAVTSSKKEFAALAFELMPKDNPALFNQAIMEFGALQCVPKNPNCEICVMNSSCLALQLKKVSVLPVKSKKLKVKHRFFNYLVFEDPKGHTAIQKRTGKGIWHNLYEFPLVETDDEIDFEVLAKIVTNRFYAPKEIVSIAPFYSKNPIHKLTHQHLHITFWRIKLQSTIVDGIDFQTLMTFPFPIVIHNFIENDFLK